MAISVKTVADKVFNLLKGYGFAVDTYDKEGNIVGDPAEAVRFYVEDPDLLVTLDVPQETIKFSVSSNTEETDVLRKQLKQLSQSYLMNLDFRVFGKTLKPISDTISVAKATKETDMESVTEATLGPVSGSTKTSYQPLDNVKIIVKHSKDVNEEIRGSRSRNINKIFIQANEERYLFPSKNLHGARAMARHIHNGGTMHDTVAESIIEMCKDFGYIKEFVSYVTKKGLVNETNGEYVSLAKEHIENIRTTFKKLSGVKTYANAVESLAEFDNIEIVNEVNLEDHFTETHFDDKVGNAHSTLSKLVNKQSAFESYIMNTIQTESFKNAKTLMQESDVMQFDTPNAQLGYRVSQLGQSATSEKLGGYLNSIGSKLSGGGTMSHFEYRAVKASLLSAQNSAPVMAETIDDLGKYESFLDTFTNIDKPFAQ
jgi:hypothetical protein